MADPFGGLGALQDMIQSFGAAGGFDQLGDAMQQLMAGMPQQAAAPGTPVSGIEQVYTGLEQSESALTAMHSDLEDFTDALAEGDNPPDAQTLSALADAADAIQEALDAVLKAEELVESALDALPDEDEEESDEETESSGEE